MMSGLLGVPEEFMYLRFPGFQQHCRHSNGDNLHWCVCGADHHRRANADAGQTPGPSDLQPPIGVVVGSGGGFGRGGRHSSGNQDSESYQATSALWFACRRSRDLIVFFVDDAFAVEPDFLELSSQIVYHFAKPANINIHVPP